MLEEDLTERLNDKVDTYDLLRTMQAFSEISSKFPEIFSHLKTIILLDK